MSQQEKSAPSGQEKGTRAVILGGLAGNVLEWYDFAVYGYFAPVLAPKFFPSDDPTASLIATFGAFAAGFLTRPLGGALFGHIGDRMGRKLALSLSVIMMAVPCCMIGLLPTHAVIGVWASVLMIALRLLQGLSVGGEYTTSIVFLVEHAPHGGRGLMGSWSGVGSVAGALLGSAVGALLNTILPPEAVGEWGWRLAFILGLGVGVVGLLLRKHIPEVELGEKAAKGPSPVVKAVRDHKGSIGRIICVLMVYAVGYYMIFLYMTTFLEEAVHVKAAVALDINTASMALLMVLIPVMARLSDRFGRKPLLLFSSVGVVALSYPLIMLMHHDNFLMIMAGQFGFAVLVAAFAGTNPATMVEAFPSHVRCSSMSIGFNISFAVFGGTTPMVAAWLISRTHDDYSLAWYIMAAGLVTTLAVIGLPETAHKRLGRPRAKGKEPSGTG